MMEFLDLQVQRAVALLVVNEPERGYYGCFSGGKDSIVVKELARMAGVRVVWHYNVTTIDPPELVQFIRRQHPDVVWDRPKRNFFSLLPERGFPLRNTRWCCKEFKESRTHVDDVLVLGIRIAESKRRRDLYTACVMEVSGRAKQVLPIRLWSDDAVWEFIRARKLRYCSLYDEGFRRLGCVGCPMVSARQRAREFERWPRFESLWKRAFSLFFERKMERARVSGVEWEFGKSFRTGEDLFEWWRNR